MSRRTTIGGRFVLEAEAASGGEGVVYRARDGHTGDVVAVKLLSGRSPADVERFKREATVCARLRHPAIVRYIAHGVTPGGPPWLALEWVEGPTLAERLRRGPIELDDVLALGRRVAEALGEAHRAGIVHRDLKPANLLLEGGAPSRVRLTDFGLAIAAGSRPGTLAAGTLRYMAPEVLRGEMEVDARADVYSLGRVLLACLAGRSVPAVLGEVVARLLTEDRALRPADGDAVVAAIDAVAAPARLRDERRLVTVVVATGPPEPALGVEGVALPGGRSRYVLSGADGARRALELARRLAGRTVVVASGRAPEHELAGQAARELSRAPEGAICVDEVTAGLIEARFEVSAAAGLLVLSGPRPDDAVRTVLGRQPPLVGRELELGTLESTLLECLQGPAAAAVLLEGRPGMGKSRLLTELVVRARRLADPPALVLAARAEPFGAGSPYALAGDAVRRAAGIHGAESPAVRVAKLRARFGGGRAAALLGELAGIPFVDEELRPLRSDAALLGDALRGAWEEWLRGETALHPVLLVVDDLHWGDLPSVALVDHALRVLADAPLYVIAGARPEVRDRFPDLWVERGLRHVRVGPLPRRAATELVGALLGDGIDEATVVRVVDRAGGNPFFLEELVRQVAAGKGDVLPETVLATLQARLDAIGPDARRVLRAASVFGGELTDAGVAALLGDESPAAVARWLDELARREVLAARPGTPVAYDFAHELLREAAYALLSAEDRAAAHHIAGEWLEWMGHADAVALAGHFERGGELERAAAWYRRGAEQALTGDDLEAAILRAELGIALVPDGEPLGGLLLVKAEALRWRGDLIAAERHASLAAERLIPGGASWFHALGERLEAAGALGMTATVEEWTRVVAEADALPPARAAQVMTLGRAAAQLYAAGRREAADAVLALAETRAEGLAGDALVEARLARVRASRALASGDFAALAALAAEAQARARAAGDQRDACLLEMDVAEARAGLGDVDGAAALLEEARAAAARMGLKQLEARARLKLGEVALLRGDHEAARAALARAAEAGRRQRDRRLEGDARAALARLALAEGDAATAEREADDARALLGRSHLPGL